MSSILSLKNALIGGASLETFFVYLNHRLEEHKKDKGITQIESVEPEHRKAIYI
jgi:hypothetical protein